MYAIDSQTYPQKMWVSQALIRALLCASLLAFGTGLAAAPKDPAKPYLSLTPQNDGKCQILSEGGKLVVLRNTHPDRSIRFRLIRYFMDVPQSRVVGAIAPGDEGQKLGCSRVDGREQFWKIERADFEQGE